MPSNKFSTAGMMKRTPRICTPGKIKPPAPQPPPPPPPPTPPNFPCGFPPELILQLQLNTVHGGDLSLPTDGLAPIGIDGAYEENDATDENATTKCRLIPRANDYDCSLQMQRTDGSVAAIPTMTTPPTISECSPLHWRWLQNFTWGPPLLLPDTAFIDWHAIVST